MFICIAIMSHMKNFIIKADFHLATMNVFHFYKILKDHAFQYFCYPMSKFKYLMIFQNHTIILNMTVHLKVVLVDWK